MQEKRKVQEEEKKAAIIEQVEDFQLEADEDAELAEIEARAARDEEIEAGAEKVDAAEADNSTPADAGRRE